MTAPHTRTALLLSVLVVAACSGGPGDSGGADAGPGQDAGRADGGPTDAGRPGDAGGAGDAAGTDAAPTDAGIPLDITYYVSTTGSDGNPGTREQPWRTIQHAEDVMGPGETTLVTAGTYDERVTVAGTDGTLDQPITFVGQDAHMNGFDVRSDYYVIRGFDIEHATASGINIQGNHDTAAGNVITDANGPCIDVGTNGGDWVDIYTAGQSNTIRNNTLTHCITAGVRTFGRDNTIDGNDISHSWGGPSGTGDADGIRFFGSGHVIRNNHIHDNSLAETPLAHPDCFQTYGPAHEITIEHNYCHLDDGDTPFQGVMMENLHEADPTRVHTPVENITFSYNVIRFGSPWYGPGFISAAKIDAGESVIHNVQITNNTFLRDSENAQYSVWLWATDGAVVKNNIFYNGVMYDASQPHVCVPIRLYQMDGFTVDADYNLAYRSDGQSLTGTDTTNGLAKGPHDIWNVDPSFNDFAGEDYRPRPLLGDGSPNPVCTGGEGGTFVGAYPCM